MKHKNKIVIPATIAALMVLIFCNKLCANAAKEGVYLCINVVIPSLLPFIYVSTILAKAASITPLKMMPPLCRLFRVPECCGHLLIIGFLGGYPVGAATIEQSYHSGQLSLHDARRMLAYCNNAGPAFIFGIVGSLFADISAPLLLWIIHILSAWITCQLIPINKTGKRISTQNNKPAKSQSIYHAMKTMGSICGWIILFRVLMAIITTPFADHMSPTVYAFICGIFELTNGCIAVQSVESSAVRFVLVAALLALGGLCITIQTASVSGPLGIKTYFPGKVLQCFLSVILSIPTASVCFSPSWNVVLTGAIMLILLISSVITTVFLRKSCSILIKDRL